MIAKIDNLLFKKILVLFWTFWWLTALWTDIVGGLAHLGLLDAPWAPDKNYPNLVDALNIYSLPNWIPIGLFLGIILWSLLNSLLFFWACLKLHLKENLWLPRAQVAFIVSLTCWLGFFIADQLVLNYELEQNHMVQGGFQLLSFFALYLLPEK